MRINGLSMPTALLEGANCRRQETELFLAWDIWLSRRAFSCRPAPTTVPGADN
jgi:hypothetical protein